MSCDQFIKDHNGNKLNIFSFTFCVICGTDYMAFCLHLWTYVSHEQCLNICCCFFAFNVCFMCYVIFLSNKLLLLLPLLGVRVLMMS